MAKYLFFAIIPLLFSCSNTKFQKRQYCSACLQNTDRILLDIQIPNLSNSERDAFFGIVEKQFNRRGKMEIGLIDDWHYEITAMNLPPEETAQLYESLGFSYLLQLGLKGFRNSEGVDVLEADKAQGLYPVPRVPLNSTSTLEMSLWDLKAERQVFLLDLFTQSTEYSKVDSDGSIYYFDAGTALGSMKSGVRRGSKYLKADCSCPKGRYVGWSKISQWL